MIPVNPGNLLKFNQFQSFQRHNQSGQNRVPFGLRAPQTRLIPFQLFISAGASTVTWKLVNPLDPTGGIDLAMTAGDLSLVDKDGGGTWITWDGLSDLTTVPDCGFWEIWLTADGTVYYSEVLHVFDVTEFAIPDWRFKFYNDNVDKGPVLYQQSYRQYFYPTKWAWDRADQVRELQVEEDGNGNEVTRFSRTVSRFKIEVPDIPDYATNFFAKCGDLSTITFSDGTESELVEMTNVVFTTRAQGIGLNIGIFTFDAEIESFNGCQENYVLA